jgi:DedD protein
MGLLSKLKFRRDPPRAGATPDTPDVVARARAMARQRLIGAAVLLMVGLVGFPLMFESQPRPIPIDVPIVIPPRDAVGAGRPPVSLGDTVSMGEGAALSQPVIEPAESGASAIAKAALAGPSGVAAPAVRQSPGPAAAQPVLTASAVPVPAPPASAPASRPVLVSKPVERAVDKSPERVAADKAGEKVSIKPTERSAEKPTPKPVDKPAEKPVDRPAEARTPPKAPAEAPAEEGRYVVQVGAFAEAAGARDARTKVESLGLKTYTQVDRKSVV